MAPEKATARLFAAMYFIAGITNLMAKEIMKGSELLWYGNSRLPFWRRMKASCYFIRCYSPA
jgi:hypothetical protein